MQGHPADHGAVVLLVHEAQRLRDDHADVLHVQKGQPIPDITVEGALQEARVSQGRQEVQAQVRQ